MNGRVVVFGYGPTGRATVERLLARGTPVRVVQRRRPADLPANAEFAACDVLDADAVMRAMQGAAQAVVTVGFAYDGRVWTTAWPKAMANLLAAAEATGARVVHVDNMYMYGPQDAPLREDMALSDFGVKPAVRSQATRMWMQAAAGGRVRWAALRAPDFYGPGVTLSHIGEMGFGRIAQGKAATLLMAPDRPHAFAYAPDIGRAAVSLLDAGDDAFGQAWHVPCAPTLTPRRILQLGAEALGVEARITAMPGWLLAAMARVSRPMREFAEMSFTWDRPYNVDATKFAARFWADATPFAVGARATAESFRRPGRRAAAGGASAALVG